MIDANIHWILSHPDKLKSPILEVGSRIVPGTNMKMDPRKWLESAGLEYFGIDILEGTNVTRTGDICREPFEFTEGFFGTIICIDVLEHCKTPLELFRACGRLLKPGGSFFVSSVMNFPVHNRPDYWRFTPDGMGFLGVESGFELTRLESLSAASVVYETPEILGEHPCIVRLLGKKP